MQFSKKLILLGAYLLLAATSSIALADVKRDLMKMNRIFGFDPKITVATLGTVDYMNAEKEIEIKISGDTKVRRTFTALSYLATFAEFATLDELAMKFEDHLLNLELSAEETKTFQKNFYLTLAEAFQEYDRFDVAVRMMASWIHTDRPITHYLARSYVRALLESENQYYFERLQGSQQLRHDSRESPILHLVPLVANEIKKQNIVAHAVKDILNDIAKQAAALPSPPSELPIDRIKSILLHLNVKWIYSTVAKRPENKTKTDKLRSHIQTILNMGIDHLEDSLHGYADLLVNACRTAYEQIANEAAATRKNETLVVPGEDSVTHATTSSRSGHKRARTEKQLHFASEAEEVSYDNEQPFRAKTPEQTRVVALRQDPSARNSAPERTQSPLPPHEEVVEDRAPDRTQTPDTSEESQPQRRLRSLNTGNGLPTFDHSPVKTRTPDTSPQKPTLREKD